MQETNQANFIFSKATRISVLRTQDGISPFMETPSDKHGQPGTEFSSDINNKRKNPFELFSLFTADIIKEKVIYTR